MNDHCQTARELPSQKKGGDRKKSKFELTEIKADMLNRSADNISQGGDDDDLGGFDRANVTMPEGEIGIYDDDEGFDANLFYGGSPNKAGLQSRRQIMNAQAFGR